MSDLQSAAEAAFPPATLDAFLRCCAGEWMSLRSQFSLGISDGDDDSWHSSERGELVVQYLEPQQAGQPGGIRFTPKGDGAQQSSSSLLFDAGGSFSTEAGQPGQWSLWPDGSLELVIEGPDGQRREKIWFTKANLRLRSTLMSRSDGSPGHASFSSEIRRVSRPTP